MSTDNNTPIPHSFQDVPRTPRSLERLPDTIDDKLDDLISTVATLGIEQKYLRQSQADVATAMHALEAKFSKVVLGNGQPGLVGKQQELSKRLEAVEERNRTVNSLLSKILVSSIGSGITILLGGIGFAVIHYFKSETGG